VVMASQGYPGSYIKGRVITGLAEAAKLPDVKVFHAGTRMENGLFVTDGGRVLGATALGDTLADAKRNAYEAVSRIHFQGAFYRSDIADKALVSREETTVRVLWARRAQVAKGRSGAHEGNSSPGKASLQ